MVSDGDECQRLHFSLNWGGGSVGLVDLERLSSFEGSAVSFDVTRSLAVRAEAVVVAVLTASLFLGVVSGKNRSAFATGPWDAWCIAESGGVKVHRVS